MLQYRKLNSSVASRDHSKDESCLKMSKGNFLKQIFVLCFLICITEILYGQTASDYRAAAERGDAVAQHNLGVCYGTGSGVEKDDIQAVYWYRKAAEKGFAKAQYALGARYYDGKGVEKNYTQTVYWWRKAAEQGYVGAQYFLGNCYRDGEGVEKNYKQAVYWYRKAAEKGFTKAQYALGARYRNGEGVEKNYTQAVYWYRKAAEKGFAKAQYFLGYCYRNGEGVEKDGNTALYWYEKALKNKDDGSLSELEIAMLRNVILPFLKENGYSSSHAKISNTATYLTTNTTNISFSSSSGTKTISVNTDGNSFDVSLLPSWCSVSKSSSSFTIICNANTGNARSDWFKVKSGEKEVRIDVSQSAGIKQSSAIVEKVWVEHGALEYFRNAYYPYNTYSVSGMRIHVKFSVEGMLGKQGNCNAYFYFSNGIALNDINNSYRTTEGKVSHGGTFTATYENSVWNDYVLFMPFDELHLAKGKHELKFSIAIFDHNGKQIATSEEYHFTATR